MCNNCKQSCDADDSNSDDDCSETLQMDDEVDYLTEETVMTVTTSVCENDTSLCEDDTYTETLYDNLPLYTEETVVA